MIREEIVSSWKESKNQLQKVCLSPQEKEYASQLEKSKAFNFNSLFSIENEDLDELARVIQQEREKEAPDSENDLLFNLWFSCWQHGGTILDWISLKRINQGLKEELNYCSELLKEGKMIIKLEASRQDIDGLARNLSTNYPYLTITLINEVDDNNNEPNYDGNPTIEEVD